MPETRIPSPVLVELQRQLNHELEAAHAYQALAIWCDLENRKGFARFFRKQASEEREHADRITQHLLDRSVLPELQSLSAPRTSFESFSQLARHAQSMEQANTAGVNAAYEAALKSKDYPAQVLLQWFIQEQVEEEAWADELVERTDSAQCAGAMDDLDRHLERYLTEPGATDLENS